MGRMSTRALLLGLACISIGKMRAQTTVTTSGGTATTVPVFTGAATVGNSTISVSGSNVGIGTASPTYPLHIRNFTTGCGNEFAAFNGSSYAVLTVQGSAPCVGTWPASSAAIESIQGGLVFDAYGSNPILLQSNRVTAMTVASGGKVGIGTLTPQYLLDVAGPIRTTSGGVMFPDGSTQTTAFNPSDVVSPTVYGNSGTTQATIAKFINGTNQSYTTVDGAGSASVVPTWTNGSQILEFVPYGSGNGIVSSYTGNLLLQTNGRATQMTILANGNVGVGTTSPQYRLSVNGTIQAKEVFVNTGWADYVFESTYRVRPLPEVAEFIRVNHRLPDIPSAAEVKERGVSLGDMQSKLLAKIEELTLQMIQLNDRNAALQKAVAKLEGR